MAKLSSDGKSVTVQKGDTLSQIALDYKTQSGGKTYKQLAALNKISNPDRIYVGQVIKLVSTSSSSGSTTKKSSTNSNCPVIDHFGELTNQDGTLYAAWSWSKSNTASYKIVWTYDTGDDIWFNGNTSTIEVDSSVASLSRQSTYSIPSNAKRVRFKVKPISKTYKKNNKDTHYWTADWSTTKTWTNGTPLDTPSVPSVEINKYKLTAELNNIAVNATQIQFQVVKNNSKSVFKSLTATIVSSRAAMSCTVDAGAEYKVRCRAKKSSSYSEWSDYSDNVRAIPSAPTKITTCKASSETSVYLAWSKVTSATSYDIEYAENQDHFKGSDQVKTVTGIESTIYDISGLTSGTEYFFRVRAVNEAGESSWSTVNSVVVGETPAAPTTWSSSGTVIAGETLNLYWVHNSRDESSQDCAELELIVNGTKTTHTIQSDTEEDDVDKTYSYSVDTSSYLEGTTIEWRVRTRGITKIYSDWSIQRTVNVYAPPTLELQLVDSNDDVVTTLTSFPLRVRALAGPNTQAAIGYHLTVTSNEVYETIDSIGNPVTINAGEEIFSRYFDITGSLLMELYAGNIDLENAITYTVTCVVSMDSGLTAEASSEFTVEWAEEHYSVGAEISLDEDILSTYITPYCENIAFIFYKVTNTSGAYVVTTEALDYVYGEIVDGVLTTTGEQVYFGSTAEEVDIYYCMVEKRADVTDVLLSVYRREFDGEFTELASGLDASKRVTITDPHPSLDYARYRVVATSESTGATSYYDMPGYPVGGKAVIIQWNEQWTEFETDEEAAFEKPPWSGSMLSLPYNIDVRDDHNIDVAHINYIGRKRPVSYYGTQLGETATWDVEIPKSDKETLYQLRRLAIWTGDVYVREPSGSGYWASISVSFSQNHTELTIPVTLDITRVEGGI